MDWKYFPLLALEYVRRGKWRQQAPEKRKWNLICNNGQWQGCESIKKNSSSAIFLYNFIKDYATEDFQQM
jgi:hypothetical protein